MTDHEEDWIEKYRAALVEPVPGKISRLFKVLRAAAKAVTAAMGGTLLKLAGARQPAGVSKPLPGSEAREHQGVTRPIQNRLGAGDNRERASKKSPPPEHRHDKKAS